MMKNIYRSLGYRDRNEIDFRIRGAFAIFYTAFFAANSRYDFLRYRECAAMAAGKITNMIYDREMALVEKSIYLDSVFYTLGVEIPLAILLTCAGLFFANVIARGQSNGWNRYLRALPVSPAMRARALFRTWAKLFGITTLIALGVSCGFSALFIDMKTTASLIPVILTIALIVETVDVFLCPLTVLCALRAEPARAMSVSFAVGGLLALPLVFVLGRFVCPGSSSWATLSNHYTYDARWLLILALCAALNIIGYLLLKKVLEKKAG
ncbi:MAG: hypothetical protein IK055_09020 [Lachnospiraceae bacterium]|nr:hypothetical protein [Lachnospiraceae bacterium]